MNKVVKDRFDEYPENARVRLAELRNLVFQIASELELGEVEETLKWGEPSYSVKTGSPLRMDWKLTTITFSLIAKPSSSIHFGNCMVKNWCFREIEQ